MVRELFGKLRELLGGKQESFLVIEDFGPGFTVTRARVKNKDKKIRIFEPAFVENFEEIKKPVLPVDKVILVVPSTKAVTIEGVIRLKRNEPDQAVSETELDTLVFRGLWEFLNRHRSTASKKLGLTDSDLILAGAEIREVLLGSYRVFNPLGFKGANLHFRYRGTFIRRDLEALLKRMENWGRERILVEGGAILALSVPWPFDYFVTVHDKTTDVFMGNGEEQAHLRTLPWGSSRILRKIASFFGTETDVVLKILLFFDSNPPSDRIKTVIEKAIKEEIGNFTKLLPESSSRKKQPLFYVIFNLPFGFFGKFLPSRVKPVDFKGWLTKQGYSVIINQENMPFLNTDSVLAFITHVYSPPQYRFLNNLLIRRARWLSAKS